MNWDRGFRRITLILSIVGAMVGAVLFFYKAKANLNYWEEKLREERFEKYDDEAGRGWINFWKNPIGPGLINKSLVERQRITLELWMKNKLEPIFLIPDELDAIEAKQYKDMLIKRREAQLEFLKERGWQTADGEAMPITPKGVWNYYHISSIETSEMMVDFFLSRIPIETTKGALLGFCAIWVFYAVMRCGAWPLYRWISIGFRGDKKKDKQKANT